MELRKKKDAPNLHLGDRTTFVVASEDGDAVFKAHFERNQEGERLD